MSGLTEDKQIPLSVVTIAYNEEKRIEECLKSTHGWADEHIIVDDFSTDRTVESARRYRDTVFQRKMDIEGAHRNWAYQKAGNAWVLSLDADEVVTDGLKREIAEVITKNTGFSAYSIPLKTYIGDYWVRYGGWYPSNKLRLFKKDKFRYEEARVHPRVILDGRCGFLKHDIVHYGYSNITELFSSLNGQTLLEAEKWITDKRRINGFKCFRKSIDRFLKAYILKKGYKDGFIGFSVSLNAGLYQVFSYLKYLEMKNSGKHSKR